MTDTKYIKLAKKLNELAKRGEGGEKETATAKLDSMMRRYGITKAMIEDPVRSWVDYKIPEVQLRIFMQVAISIIGRSADIRHIAEQDPYKPMMIVVKATHAEGIEIRAKHEFFWRAYQEELDIFTHAFVQKNELLPSDAGEVDVSHMEQDEFDRMIKIMQAGIKQKKHHYRQQLEGEEKE
jgi:hypothetical protein